MGAKKTKMTRRADTVTIKAEMNELENFKISKSQQNQNLFFKKINNIGKLFMRLRKKKDSNEQNHE